MKSVGATLKYRNQFLDKIDTSNIESLKKFNAMDGRICPYVIVINFKDGSIDQHEYYSKWQRNKDFLNLNIFRKRKEEKDDNQRIAGSSKSSAGTEERIEFSAVPVVY